MIIIPKLVLTNTLKLDEPYYVIEDDFLISEVMINHVELSPDMPLAYEIYAIDKNMQTYIISKKLYDIVYEKYKMRGRQEAIWHRRW